jgi:hypothetical protein
MTFLHDDALRRRITTNVAAHHRTTVELDGRRHAAVAIVVVDSVPGSDPDDPADVGDDPLINVMRMLDDYPSRSGFVITPVVIWAPGAVELLPNPAEVANVYRVGLHELCRPDSPRFVHIPESDRPVVQLPLGGSLIHAPTGAVMLQFRWVGVEGRLNERVDHLEQPVFAWR